MGCPLFYFGVNMPDIKPSYKDSWWWRLITLAPLLERFDKAIDFLKELTDKLDSHSSHRAINLTWGIGSFVCFWVNHFIYNHGKFATADYVFIATMAGITTMSAVLSKGFDPKPTEDDDGPDTISK